MHRVVQTGIGAHATLETLSAAIDLAQELDLEPPLVALDFLCRLQGAREFRDAHKLNRRDQVHETLRDSDKRTNLSDSVNLTAVYWRYSCDVVIQGYGNSRAKNVPNPPDDCWVARPHAVVVPALAGAPYTSSNTPDSEFAWPYSRAVLLARYRANWLKSHKVNPSSFHNSGIA